MVGLNLMVVDADYDFPAFRLLFSAFSLVAFAFSVVCGPSSVVAFALDEAEAALVAQGVKAEAIWTVA